MLRAGRFGNGMWNQMVHQSDWNNGRNVDNRLKASGTESWLKFNPAKMLLQHIELMQSLAL